MCSWVQWLHLATGFKMQTVYATQNVTISPRKAIRGELVEHGVVVAHFKRGAIQNRFVPPFETKFLSSHAKARFEDFCDCLSIGETVEALTPGEF